MVSRPPYVEGKPCPEYNVGAYSKCHVNMVLTLRFTLTLCDLRALYSEPPEPFST